MAIIFKRKEISQWEQDLKELQKSNIVRIKHIHVEDKRENEKFPYATILVETELVDTNRTKIPLI